MSKKRYSASDTPLPDAFIEEMKRQLGPEETALLVEELGREPSVSIRLNRRKVKDIAGFMRRFEEYGVSPVEWCDSGFYLDRRPDFIHDPLLHAGVYYVQEAASMVYESIVRDLPFRPRRVLDLCAAPGGKSTAMLNALEGDYILVANEVERSRARILKENLDKWGDPPVIITNSPAGKFGRMEGYFDLVAVDAPCSGEGMMRREPVARSQWSPALMEQCSRMQRDILADAIEALADGGCLIYSTCTFNTLENEANVEWLRDEFGLTPIGEPRHFMPHRERCEGLFVAVFQKPGAPLPILPATSPKDAEKALRRAGVNILGVGTEKTVMKGDVEIPSSRQVLACDYDPAAFPSAPLGHEESVAYLRRNAITLPPDVPKGYVAVSYEGFPLGLVKNLGNRANNLYPAEWRVLT